MDIEIVLSNSREIKPSGDPMAFAARILFALLIVGFGVPQKDARADVWETTSQWDTRQEEVFSNWIHTLPLSFFTSEKSKYGAIATDCADAAYALRVIFAYEHGLPVQFSSGADLTNSTKRFDAETDEIKRVRKFIRYVLNETNTRTLIEDTYPIAINRRYLRAGALYLNPDPTPSQIRDLGIPAAARSGHVYYIRGVAENGMIDYFSSTVPVMVRDLQLRTEITIAPFATTGGYRAFRWPGLPVSQQNGFSTEQYRFASWHPNDFTGADSLWDDWQAVVRSRLALRQATPMEELQARLTTVQGYIKERTKLVDAGWNLYVKKYHRSACMSSADYDDLSTPSRDVKIQNELIDLKNAAIKYLQSQGEDTDGALSGLFDRYNFDLGHGMNANLNQIWSTFNTTTVLVISEPEHSPAVRWGLKTQGEWPCPQNRKNYKNIDLAE
jgi:hypothetical protein